MNDMNIDYSDYLSSTTATTSPGREFVSMQELSRLGNDSDADCSPSSMNSSSLSRQTSSSGDSSESWFKATNGLVMRSPHQSGVALRWMPVLESCLSKTHRGRSAASSAAAAITEDASRRSIGVLSPGLSQSDYEVDLAVHADCTSSVQLGDCSTPLAARQTPHTLDWMQLNDQAIEQANNESQLKQANQHHDSSRVPSESWIETREIRRITAAKERRKLQNRRAQQAYRARQEQILLKLQEQLAAVNEQLASSNEQHTSDAEEIRRLNALLLQLEEDNKALRNWVELSVSSHDFDFVFTSFGKPVSD